jgi:glycosyltransferase involved in cell wall biosynthesis
MVNKIKVYHFNNGSGGGVLSVIRNLLQFSSNPFIENHVIYTINKDLIKEYPVNNIKGAATEQVFYYSPRYNFLHTCKALSKLIPDEKAVLVSHDWLELGMISNLGLQNPVVTFLHGDYSYYYELASLHQAVVDSFIAVAGNIEKKLQQLLPLRKEDIHYLRFPVPSVKNNPVQKNENNIIFIGRLSNDKGYHLLARIDDLLLKNGFNINWHIVGESTVNKNDAPAGWEERSSVKLYGKLKNEDVLLLLEKMDYFILPSSHEGLPVTLVEAMKCGVIPLVNNIEGGIQELVLDNITGFKITANNTAEYAGKISELLTNKSLVNTLQHNCITKANLLFDPCKNTNLIEELIYSTTLNQAKKKKVKKIYGSRLDKKWIPNFITKTVRGFK